MSLIFKNFDNVERAIQKHLPNIEWLRLQRWNGPKGVGEPEKISPSDLIYPVEVDQDHPTQMQQADAWSHAVREWAKNDRLGETGTITIKVFIYGTAPDRGKMDLCGVRFQTEELVSYTAHEREEGVRSPLPPLQLQSFSQVNSPRERLTGALGDFVETLSAINMVTREGLNVLREEQAIVCESLRENMALSRASLLDLIRRQETIIKDLSARIDQLQGDARAYTQQVQSTNAEERLKAEQLRAGTELGVTLIRSLSGIASTYIGAQVPPELVELLQTLDPELLKTLSDPKTLKLLKHKEVQDLIRTTISNMVAAAEKAEAEEKTQSHANAKEAT